MPARRSFGVPYGLARAVALAGSLCLLGAAAPAARAAIARTDTGNIVSYRPTAARVQAARLLTFGPTTAASPTAPVYKECDNSEAVCLRYYGGPVMRTATLTPVFWNPKGLGLSYPSGYQATIEQFFVDVAHDSGTETDFYSVLPQYYDTVGGGTHHVEYSASVGTPVEDTDALPSAAEDLCSTPFVKTTRPCVQDKGVRAELATLVAKDSLPTGVGHEYVVFFPPGIDSCFDSGGSEEDGECSGTGYCGYHGTIASGGASSAFEYANEPDNGDPQYKGACTTATGLAPAEITLSSTSHEVSESITDPEVETTLSWYDEHTLGEFEYGEVGDICAYEYAQGEAGGGLLGGHLKAPAGDSNQTIDGHPYLLQDEWDNSHDTCSISERASATKALFSDSASAPIKTGESVSFDATGSFAPVAIDRYEWEWGDGISSSGTSPTIEHTYAGTQGALTKKYTVKLTVTDANGNQASTIHTVEVEDRPPTAQFATPSSPTAGTPSSFDGSGSTDPDGSIVAYSWEFGDGTAPQEGASPSHTYAAAGEYTVTLKVTDNAGATAKTSHELLVEPATELSHSEHKEEGGPEVTAGSSSTSNTPLPPRASTGGAVTAKGAPSARLRVLSIKQRRRLGTLRLALLASGAGVVVVREAGSTHVATASPLARTLLTLNAFPIALSARAKGPLVKPANVEVGASGNVTFQIAPSAAGRVLLVRKHKLTVKLLIVFTATGGSQSTVSKTVTLILNTGKNGSAAK